MPTTRRRRIVKRAVMALAGVVLLPVWYVLAWLTWPTIERNSVMSVPDAAPLFVPIERYCEADLPGSSTLRKWDYEVNTKPIWVALTRTRGSRFH